MINVVLIGGGGHSKVIQAMIDDREDMKLLAIIDQKYEMAVEEGGVKFAPFSYVSSLVEEGCKVCIAIGNNRVRKKIMNSLKLKEDDLVTIIDSSAIVKNDVIIGKGTVIMPRTVINPGTEVGINVIVNTGAIVEHDNVLEDFVHISPGAVLAGGVTVKEGTQLSVNSSVIPLKTIGEWSMIGAGSTVIDNIPSDSTAVGSPAKVIKKREG